MTRSNARAHDSSTAVSRRAPLSCAPLLAIGLAAGLVFGQSAQGAEQSEQAKALQEAVAASRALEALCRGSECAQPGMRERYFNAVHDTIRKNIEARAMFGALNRIRKHMPEQDRVYSCQIDNGDLIWPSDDFVVYAPHTIDSLWQDCLQMNPEEQTEPEKLTAALEDISLQMEAMCGEGKCLGRALKDLSQSDVFTSYGELLGKLSLLLEKLEAYIQHNEAHGDNLLASTEWPAKMAIYVCQTDNAPLFFQAEELVFIGDITEASLERLLTSWEDCR